jgi:hypothetical protein
MRGRARGGVQDLRLHVERLLLSTANVTHIFAWMWKCHTAITMLHGPCMGMPSAAASSRRL